MVRKSHMVHPGVISPGMTLARRYKLNRSVLKTHFVFDDATDIGVQNRIQQKRSCLPFGLRLGLRCT